jgi:hypothetical protein
VLLNDGAQCPAEYPEQHTLQQEGTCGCACGVEAEGCPEEVTLYSDDACTQGASVADANGTCVSAGTTIVSSAQAPEATLTCAAASTPSGGMPRTLCCQATP